jgi:hypothetical protein
MAIDIKDTTIYKPLQNLKFINKFMSKKLLKI